jgi:hypothetical protein
VCSSLQPIPCRQTPGLLLLSLWDGQSNGVCDLIVAEQFFFSSLSQVRQRGPLLERKSGGGIQLVDSASRVGERLWNSVIS